MGGLAIFFENQGKSWFGSEAAFWRNGTVLALASLLLSGCASWSVPAVVADLPLLAPAEQTAQEKQAWLNYRRAAALQLVQRNPQQTYMDEVPEPLLAIPVLEVELQENGHIKSVEVRRTPTQALDTIALAKEALERAAPFPPVTGLAKPWKYQEIFLFNDDRRFKPAILDR